MAQDRAALEADIGRRLDAGDVAAAATSALRGYGPEIRGYLASILRDDQAAADVFADFAEDLWRGLPGFRRQSSVRTWAFRIAWNAAQMFWRDPYRRRMRRLSTSEYSRIADQLRTSSIRPDPQAAADRLARLRDSLQPDEQTLLILRIDKRLTWNEIAHVLAEGEDAPDAAALRKRFERLKQRLLKLAEREGLRAPRQR